MELNRSLLNEGGLMNNDCCPQSCISFGGAGLEVGYSTGWIWKTNSITQNNPACQGRNQIFVPLGLKGNQNP